MAEGLRMRVTYGDGKNATLDSGAGSVAPDPVETLLAALGGCHAMDIISILRKKRQDVTAYRVDVTGERRTEHPRSFTRIEMVHRLKGHDLSPGAIAEAIRLSETKYCSVRFSLDPAIAVVNRFEIETA
ncbi:MAG TPA: OsmC family protein [Candidatus Udaeobacter sp.]|nr:OsmC family protein [Candidatus Udaeobacter sp.]